MAEPAYVEALIADGARASALAEQAAKARSAELDRAAAGIAAIVGAINPIAGLVVAAAWKAFEAAGSWLSGPDPNSDEQKKRSIAAIRRWWAYGRPAFRFEGDVWPWEVYADYLESALTGFDSMPDAEAAACARLAAALADHSGDPAVVTALSARHLYSYFRLHSTPAPIGPDGALVLEGINQKTQWSRASIFYIGPDEPLLAAALAASAVNAPIAPVQRAAVRAWLAWEESAARGVVDLSTPVDPSVPGRRWGAIALAAVTAADEAKPTRSERRLNLRQFRAVASPSVEPGGGSNASTSPQLALRGQTTPAATTAATSSVSQPSGSLSTGAKVAIVAGGGLGVVALVVALRRLGWF